MQDNPAYPAEHGLRWTLQAGHHRLPMMLSFAACFIDVVCILGLFHTFTAAITGSLVILCADLFTDFSAAALKLVVLVTFIPSSFFWYALLVSRARPGIVTLRNLFLIEAALIAVVMVLTGLSPPSDPLQLEAIVAVALCTIAMALQNVIMQVHLNQHGPTTFMTGNSLKFVTGLVDAKIRGGKRQPADADIADKALRHGGLIIAFAVGGLAGGLCMRAFGFWCLAVPCGLLCLAAWAQVPDREAADS